MDVTDVVDDTLEIRREHVAADNKSPSSRQNKMLGLNVQIVKSYQHFYHITLRLHVWELNSMSGDGATAG